MRGFQTWSQNLNRITFDPVSGQKKKRSKLAKYPTLPIVFEQKRIKCYHISILRPDLASPHQGASFRTQNERRLKKMAIHRTFRTWLLMRTAWCKSILWRKWYHWTRNALENHISPDPVNFSTEVEIWDTVTCSHQVRP